jgi:D-alanyl-D-alanine carboxypeptidase (penicillin-binding protein 5/6)
VRRAFLAVVIACVGVGAVAGGASVASGAGASAGPVPPPTPVPPFGSPSPYPRALATPDIPATTPVLSAPSGALVDLDSGRVLYAIGGRTRRPIASTTKIMTALLVLESARLREMVTVSPLAAAQGGASLGLESGERIMVRHLLYALMLQSSNDAAVALAEHAGGSVEGFVAGMNKRARALGLRNTHFMSPNGLDDRGYSTALDLARITVRAMRDQALVRIARTKFYTVPSSGEGTRRLQNRNALLWLYPGAFGLKSGFTGAAGSCLVAAADRDGFRLASVVLGAPAEAFSDSATLLDWGFSTYELRRVVIGGERFDPLHLQGQEVALEAARTLKVLVRQGAQVTRRVEVAADLELPLAEGERLGEVVVTLANGRELGRTPLVSVEAVAPAEPRSPFARRLWEAASGFVAAMFRSALS